MGRSNRPYDSEDDYDEFEDSYEYQKNKHLYKDKAHWNEPYERVDGEGRGEFPEHFPAESFEDLQEFDESHEWVEVRKDQEYYENYIKEIGKEKDALVDEHEKLTAQYEEMLEELNKRYKIEKEKSNPFIPEIEGQEELDDLYDQIELIEYKLGVLDERFSDASLWATLDGLKSKERYWAERYGKELEQIRKDEIDEKERKGEFYERGEEYYSSDDSVRSKRYKMSLKLDMANDGLTPDAIGEVLDEYDGLVTSGDGYVRAQENLAENLDKISYEEALEILAEGKKEGKYSDEMYYKMQATIRRHYKV